MSGSKQAAVKDIPVDASAAEPCPRDVQAAIALYTAGRLVEAETKAHKLIRKFPGAIDVHNLLGAVQEGLGNAELAIASYARAIAIKPDFLEAHNNLAGALNTLGRYTEAVAICEGIIRLKPDFAEAHGNLGNALKELGRLEEAVPSHREAVRLNPDSHKAHKNLGIAFAELGQFEEAAASYFQALRVKPGSADVLSGFADALQHLNSADVRADFKDLIILCFESAAIGSHMVRPASHAILKSSLRKFLKSDAVTEHDLADLDPSTGALLVTHLSNTLIADTDLEIFLSRVRSKFLELRNKRGHEAGLNESVLRLLEALATQGFLNEYVWHVTDGEKPGLDALEVEISQAVQSGGAPGVFDLYLLAAYRPLYANECIRRWALAHPGYGDAGLGDFLESVILNPEKEREIGQRMERLTPIENDVSVAVRAQYEENPYPRWDSLTIGKPRPYTEQILKDIAPHRPGLEPASPAPDVLIAGCGTGQHPISCGLSYRDSNVLAVDLSRTSLAFAKRKAEELKVPNIRFAQADILKLGVLEDTFDIIECGGVLHHMADPGAGLEILLECLKPGGFLRLGLYSELARQKIVRLRRLVSDKAFEASLRGIRDFRRYVRESENPDVAELQQSNDFYTVSGLRDLIFHVQEHRFTIPKTGELLDDHKLEFLGFNIKNPRVKSSYLTQFPDDPDGLNLENWHQYEQDNPHIFSGMYQFWCRKGV